MGTAIGAAHVAEAGGSPLGSRTAAVAGAATAGKIVEFPARARLGAPSRVPSALALGPQVGATAWVPSALAPGARVGTASQVPSAKTVGAEVGLVAGEPSDVAEGAGVEAAAQVPSVVADWARGWGGCTCWGGPSAGGPLQRVGAQGPPHRPLWGLPEGRPPQQPGPRK